MAELNPPEHGVAYAAESMLGAPHGLRHVSGGQFGPLYHGTPYNWKEPVGLSHDSPLHVDTDKHDFPTEQAFGFGSGNEQENWQAMNQGRVKEFKFRSDARIHVTDTEHRDGVLPQAEHEAVKKGNYDATMFKHRGQARLGTVYNPDALEHVQDLGYKQVTGSSPESEMEGLHGEDWRDWV